MIKKISERVLELHSWFESYCGFARLDRFCLSVELHPGGSATDQDVPCLNVFIGLQIIKLH